MRIALIHALRHSPPPIEAAFARLWPDAQLMNLLDDSLAADLARDGRLTEAMTLRFQALTAYAVSTGADAVLFTCSAFGPCIESCQARWPTVPILKPNEAMIDAVSASVAGGRIGLLATFAPTLASMPPEFGQGANLQTVWAAGALDALDRGDTATHDRLVAEAALALKDCDVIALAQFSTARAADAVRQATGRPVFTTPDCAVGQLRMRLET